MTAILAKGDKVVFKAGAYGTTAMTEEERAAFYKEHRGLMRDDGESYLCPRFKEV